MICVKNLTMKYPSGKGIFDLNFDVKQGSVLGYLGPNGAGKTTTIRQLMGFMKPDSGSATIGGLDCFENAAQIQKTVGYLAGEISFLEGMNGDEYLSFISEIRGIKDKSAQKRLLDMFELSPKGKIKKYSKGMKQKLGIVAAFMHSPEVLILDEPTSGLDPLMQNRFIELVLEEKKKGRTILMSSHIFEEVERTCDNVLIIKDGFIVANADVETLKNNQRKCFVLGCGDNALAQKIFLDLGLQSVLQNNRLEVFVTGEQTNLFTSSLSKLEISSFDIKHESLEDVFMHFYTKEKK